MFEDFVLQVVLDVSRHDDKRLPDEIEKHAAQQRHQQDHSGVYEDSEREDMKKAILEIEPLKSSVDIDVVDDEIDRITHQLTGDNLKCVGNDYEQRTENQVPFVFEEIFIEVPEFFHRVEKNTLDRR
jgi:hypothetical protein